MTSNRLITILFSNCFDLINLAIQPPLTLAAFIRPPSTLAVEFYYSETRACSCWPFDLLVHSHSTFLFCCAPSLKVPWAPK